MGVSLEGPSMTVTQDERLESRVFNSDVVFCSKTEAFLYVALHRRDPGEQKTEVSTSISDSCHRCWLIRGQTFDTSDILCRNSCRLRQKSRSPLPQMIRRTHLRYRQSVRRKTPGEHLFAVVGTVP